MNTSVENDGISFPSFNRGVKGYSWTSFRSDLVAGLAVALVTVPQAMVYALVAGLPLSCGMLAAVFSSLLATLFGSSRFMVVGPTNAIAILVLYGTQEVLMTYYRDLNGSQLEMMALSILTQLSLLVGIMQIAVAGLKLGRLTQFVSFSVVVGYLVGTVLTVVINQLFGFLGIVPPGNIFSLWGRIVYMFTHIGSVHLPTLLVGLGSLLLFLGLRRIHNRIPAAAIMLCLSSLLVHYLGLSSYSVDDVNSGQSFVAVVGDSGELQSIIPTLSLPYFDMGIINKLLPIAFAIALLGILETTLVAKSIAARSGDRFSVNQEILGLGIGNLFSSFIGALPSSGSPTRSTLLYNDGAKSHFGAIFSALWVGFILLLFGDLMVRIPIASLAAILLATAMNIVNTEQFFLCLKATYSDALVLITTLVACLVFSIDIAFYLGIMISITLYLKNAAVPNLVECTFDESGQFVSVHDKHKSSSQIRLINVQGELFFGAADIFQSMLKSIAKDDASLKVIILRLKNARDMDATSCLALQQLSEYLRSTNRYLVACGITHENWQVLCDSGTVQSIGKDNLFLFQPNHPQQSLQTALKRARYLILKDSNSKIPETLEEPSSLLSQGVMESLAD